eukprot:1733950-Pyramimonas_sp.AAC.1
MRACSRAGTRGSLPEAPPGAGAAARPVARQTGAPRGHHHRLAPNLKPFSSQRALILKIVF